MRSDLHLEVPKPAATAAKGLPLKGLDETPVVERLLVEP